MDVDYEEVIFLEEITDVLMKECNPETHKQFSKPKTVEQLKNEAEDKKNEGNTHYKNKKYKQACELYSKAIDLCPGCAAYYGNRCAARMMLSQYNEALEDARQSTRLQSSFIKGHLREGKCHLALGNASAAIYCYHTVLQHDSTNTEAKNEKETAGRLLALETEKVIELKPGFIGARLQRANVFLKQGKYEEATEDYKVVLESDATNSQALQHLEEIKPLREEIEHARQLVDQHSFQEAIEILSKAIEISPWYPELREIRSECYIHVGEYFKAIQDTKTTAKLVNDNTAAYYKVSQLHYEIGEADESLHEIRECLKLDPDHKECFPFYKKVKKLVKQIKAVQDKINEQQYEDCVEKAHKMLKTEPKVYSFVSRARSHICHCHSKAGHTKEALDACDKVLEMDENNIEALCDKADAYINNEQLDEAVQTYQKAANIDGNYRRAQEGLQRSQKLLKQSQKRDYYKILGVRRNAKKPEIIRAYRKLAVKWHPDKYDGDDKKKAEKMFIDVAAAKEVLTDPEKRSKFDNGEDPLDAEQQAHGGGQGNPFFFNQGFNPFGSDGFKFHFN